MIFYSSKHPTTTKRRKKIVLLSPKTLGIGFILISLAFLLFWSKDQTSSTTSSFSRVIHIPIATVERIRNFFLTMVIGFRENFDAKNKLVIVSKENEELRLENQELRFKLRRYEHYREAFELPREEGMPMVTAIVVIPDFRMTQSLIINRGTEDGLDVDMPVLTSAGLIGRTTRKITQHAAQVQPLTDPRSAVGVYIKDSPYEGILRGTENGEHLLLTDLFLNGAGDETLQPKPGDKLYTSGHGRIFPRDLLAGIISAATSEEGLVVDPLVNIQSVKAVMVLLRTQLQNEMLSLLKEDS